MCNLSQTVLLKGWEQGMKQGRDETIARSARNLMKKTGWSVDETLSALEIPEAERDGYAEKIMAQ